MDNRPFPDLRAVVRAARYRPIGQRTIGGMELSMVSILAPVLKPNIVPRS